MTNRYRIEEYHHHLWHTVSLIPPGDDSKAEADRQMAELIADGASVRLIDGYSEQILEEHKGLVGGFW